MAFLEFNQEKALFEREYSFLLDYLLQNDLLCKAQVAYLLLAHAYSHHSIVVLILNAGFLSYESCIKSITTFTGALHFEKSSFEKIIGKYADVNFYCRSGYLPYQNAENDTCILVKNLDLQLINNLINKNAKVKVSICTACEFFHLLEIRFQPYVLAQSKSFVKFVNLVGAQDLKYGYIILRALTLFTGSLLFCPWIFHLTNAFILLSQNCFKIFLLWTSLVRNKEFANAEEYYFTDYPMYTILVPMYKESNASSILHAISRLFYPKHKLDVKLLIEEDDQVTDKAIRSIDIPYYVHILRIPDLNPKTKPKALNFAMPYVTGQYLTIYDAEDIPEPSQLIKALESFARLPLNYMCLQAKLRFYNMNENMLTKMMSIEYSILFNFLVYGLSVANFPVPLGGTSNHFKTMMLHQIGCWDAYNVAEDADLGIRIFANQYRVGVIDSFTSEEAPVHLWAWLLQRSRWIKGYWQTFSIFLCQRERFSFKQAFGVYNFVGFATYNQLIYPIFIFYMLFGQGGWFRFFWFLNTLASVVYVIFASILGINKLGLADKKYKYLTLSICYTAYFSLHFIASIIAILDLAVTPFRWQKTEHGLSKAIQKPGHILLRDRNNINKI